VTEHVDPCHRKPPGPKLRPGGVDGIPHHVGVLGERNRVRIIGTRDLKTGNAIGEFVHESPERIVRGGPKPMHDDHGRAGDRDVHSFEGLGPLVGLESKGNPDFAAGGVKVLAGWPVERLRGRVQKKTLVPAPGLDLGAHREGGGSRGPPGEPELAVQPAVPRRADGSFVRIQACDELACAVAF
jgi:hypothetical protein